MADFIPRKQISNLFVAGNVWRDGLEPSKDAIN
jgi:hypothetical protein